MSWKVRCCCAAQTLLVTGPEPVAAEYACSVCGRSVMIVTSTTGVVVVRGRGPRLFLAAAKEPARG